MPYGMKKPGQKKTPAKPKRKVKARATLEQIAKRMEKKKTTSKRKY